MSRHFHSTVLPTLAESGAPYSFFFEVKSNLKENELDEFVKGGVNVIQPGIESLCSHTLSRIDKGVSGVRNIWLLRECLSRNIAVIWNLLVDVPGDNIAGYETFLRLWPSICHLPPPRNVSDLSLIHI